VLPVLKGKEERRSRPGHRAQSRQRPPLQAVCASPDRPDCSSSQRRHRSAPGVCDLRLLALLKGGSKRASSRRTRPGGWSVYGAERWQPVATARKWNRRENRSKRRKPLPWVATGCCGNAMVTGGRRFESVRGLQGAAANGRFLNCARCPFRRHEVASRSHSVGCRQFLI
jgi:hypothetical protein